MSSDLNYTIVLNEQGPMGPAGAQGDPGPMGVGINSIIKTSTSGLVDTYTITYTNGIHQTFNVTNGNGIERIELLEPTVGQNPTVDMYQITTTNGSSYTFSVTNGSSIDNIAKTSTSGLVDTYTITLTNGDTETFEVTNGRAGEITNVTASVDSNVGTPSVDVTLGGTADQRTIDLAFHNLKGQQGDTPDLSNYVTLDTSQTISGHKTFSGGISISGSANPLAVTTSYGAFGTHFSNSGLRLQTNMEKMYLTTYNKTLDVDDILTSSDLTGLANNDLSNLSTTGEAHFQSPLVSGINIKTINGSTILGSGDLTINALPSQSGQSGKFLTTNGTDASWVSITFPTVDQTYNSASANAQSGVAIAGVLGNYVDTSTNQTIAGTKTFSGTIIPTYCRVTGQLIFPDGGSLQSGGLDDLRIRSTNSVTLWADHIYATTDGTNKKDLKDAQLTTNLVTSVDSSSTDTQYPSAKLLYDTVGDIETLINAL